MTGRWRRRRRGVKKNSRKMLVVEENPGTL
jgi:hypothetical protein